MEEEVVKSECKEVRVTVRPDNISSLVALMKGGFVIKNIDDVRDKKPTNWVLIMEKVS